MMIFTINTDSPDLPLQYTNRITNQPKNKMQQDSSDVSAKVLLEIKNMTMHRFVNNKKSMFTSGNCKIAKIDHNNGSTVYFINMNSFYYTLRKDITFVKMVYDETISYLFPHFENGLSTLTVVKNAPEIHNLEETLKNAANLIDFETAMNDSSIRAKIQQHCPTVGKQPVMNPDQIKQTISTTGKLLGTAFTAIGGMVKQGVKMAGDFIDNKLAPGENGQVDPATRQKWESLKKGTNDIIKMSVESYNAYLDPYVKPIIQKGQETYTSAETSVKNSENPNVKYARELGEQSVKALGEAFDGLLKGGKQVGEEFSNQTKKIVKKKYGDDYVKTFIDGEGVQRPIEEKQPTRGGLTESEEKIEYPSLLEKKE